MDVGRCGLAELLAALARPETRAAAAVELCERMGSTPAYRHQLLRAVGAESEPEVDARAPPLTLDRDFTLPAVDQEALRVPNLLGGEGERLRSSIVPTQHAQRVLRQLALALCLERPVLLSGPPGAGKTTLLRVLAESTPLGHPEAGRGMGGSGIFSETQLDKLVIVHLDEQVDSRALLGSYVCGAEPGEFVWQPGVITQAVAEGRWLLLEDVDRAPLEVMSALASLLERNVLFVPGRAASLRAAPGFRLWGTVTTHGHTEVAAVERTVFRVALWQHVSIASPSDADLSAIVRVRFPPLAAAAEALVASFVQLQHASGGPARTTESSRIATDVAKVMVSGEGIIDSTTAKIDEDTEKAPSLALAAEQELASARLALSGGRVFSSRELFRWCRRITIALAPTGNVLPPPDLPGRFTSFYREILVAEALDTFVAPVRRAGPRAELACLIAKQWQLPTERLTYITSLRRPDLETSESSIRIGRVELPLSAPAQAGTRNGRRFAATRHALVTLERVAAAMTLNEPLLLVGETGTGKTTAVQQLAVLLGKTLLVHNLNQQSDSSELVGGFRPVQPRHIFAPLAARFESLFCRSFSRSKNGPFLAKLAQRLAKGEWAKLLALITGAHASYAKLRAAAAGEVAMGNGSCAASDTPNVALDAEWEGLGSEAARLQQRLKARAAGGSEGLAFAFVEGTMVRALREGHWLLLDEMNLASAETLERVAGLLEEGGSLALTEKGEAELVPRHPGFRLFAAMNPPTDFGKKELPGGIRTRLTELYVPSLSSAEDLALVVLEYLSPVLPSPPVGAVVALYQAAVEAAATRLLDGADQRPEYSLRTLCRALSYVARALPLGYGLQRALYDGFHMTFVAQLQARFQPEMEALLLKHLLPARPGKPHKPPAALAPARPPGEHWVEVGGFWLATDPRCDPVADDPRFIVTPTIEARLRQLARMVSARRHPILLQGPTSAGKTSMVERLARRTGHRLVRINNHEHTDVQEYIGSFQPDAHGRLVFHDGALAQAVRHGYWIVLDELNLAQSEVLEALNRLLDDNRELFIPETSETLSPHPSFMLFATQNPPGAYGGRKVLSRAFRNRFLEMQMDEIPEPELVTILERRSELPASFCKAMVGVMQELQRRRSSSRVFAGRAGFITPRDLFRWADRRPLSYQELAEAGYALLAERLRAPAERETVAQVLCKLLPRVAVEPDALYERLLAGAPGGAPALGSMSAAGTVWLPSTRRLYALVAACMQSNEPILLVGETGTGKTTICQLFAQAIGQRLHIINCHQHTETADFVGGLRPARGRALAFGELERRVASVEAGAAAAVDQLRKEIASVGIASLDTTRLAMLAAASDEAKDLAGLRARVERVASALRGAREALNRSASDGGNTGGLAEAAEEVLRHAEAEAEAVHRELRANDALFVWVDGPLLTAMRTGEMLLIDEISLAEDSVLERLNSVLDPCRILTVPEKGSDLEVVKAAPSFRLLATMNPGGDFGKKELSPALRNRFTEVWVPSVTAYEELRTLIGQTLGELGDVDADGDDPMGNGESFEWSMAEAMLAFVDWLAKPRGSGNGGAGLGGGTPSLRDLLAWASFIKATRIQLGSPAAFVHGACLTFVDAMGLQVSASRADREALRTQCVSQLISLLPPHSRDPAALYVGTDTFPDFASSQIPALEDPVSGVGLRRFGLAPFFVPIGGAPPQLASISLSAPTPRSNAFRLFRAMQLRKPVLLEGSPGVGKTSLVQALGAACGHRVVRINLSEQTDLMDLLGSDLPVEGAPPGTYAWQDGAFLAALRAGHWVILDELNLAPQAVLEGLNSCLDHRATVFIPELGASFECPPTFRVFGCQNPLQQGGGRKGLPRSFLNRFTQVWMEELGEEDMIAIGLTLFGQLGKPLIRRLVSFVRALQRALSLRCFGVAGGPWDFNLRDVFRWCELMLAEQKPPHWRPAIFLDALVLQRFRTEADRQEVMKIFVAEMGGPNDPFSQVPPLQPHYSVSTWSVQIGHVWLGRARAHLPDAPLLELLPSQLRPLQSLALAVRMGWMCAVCGDAGSGKSSTLRLLASLAGRRLDEVVLSTATDTTELLGCFEQSEASRLQLAVLSEASVLVETLTGALALVGTSSTIGRGAPNDALSLAISLQRSYAELDKDGTAENRAIAGPTPSQEWADSFEARASSLVSIFDEALAMVVDHTASVASRIARLRTHLCALSDLRQTGSKGRFVWVDGPLVRAMEEGHWLLLDNANLCNPSVLDRLNPLFERDGQLQLPEAGLQAGGEVRHVQLHPDFRLFLAVVPSAGELSRAMRNRGIEVAMLPPPARSRDVLSLLRCSTGAMTHPTASGRLDRLDEAGVPGVELSLAMVDAHARIESQVPRWLGHRSLLHCGELFVRRLSRGAALQEAMIDAIELAYEARLMTNAALEMRNVFDGACVSSGARAVSRVLTLEENDANARPLWPVSVSTSSYASNPRSCTVRSQAALVVQLVSLMKPAAEGTLTPASSSFPKRCAPDELLSAAVIEFIYRASTRDEYLRIALLANLQESHGVPVPLGLRTGSSMLAQLHKLPLVLQARNALEAACAGDESLRDMCRDAPIDMPRLNAPLFERVRKHADADAAPDLEDSEVLFEQLDSQVDRASLIPHTSAAASAEAAVTAWSQYCRILPRLRLVLRLEWQRLSEQSRLEEALASCVPQDMSLLEQSFAYSTHGSPSEAGAGLRSSRSAQRAVWNNLVNPLFPAMRDTAQMLCEWLSSSPVGFTDETMLLSTAEAVIQARGALTSRALRTTMESFQPQEFLVLWRALHKRVYKASLPPLSLPVTPALARAFASISAAVGYEATRFAPLLWKWGGHPTAPPSQELLEAGMGVRQIAAELVSQCTELGRDVNAAADQHKVALRRSIVLGACTLQCAYARRRESALEIDRLRSIPTAIRGQLDVFKAKNEASQPAKAERAIPPLGPLLDTRSARVEGALFCSLSSLVSQDAEDDLPDRASALRVRAMAFSELVVASCARSALDAGPAQTLAWQLETLTVPRGLEATRNEASLDSDKLALAGVAYQLAVTWHRHLWRGGFEYVSTVEGAGIKVGGPASLLLSMEALPVCARLEAAFSVPVAERTTALHDLRQLCEIIRTRSPQDDVSAQSDWMLALHTLCRTLAPFARDLDEKSGTELKSSVRDFEQACAYLLDTGWRQHCTSHTSLISSMRAQIAESIPSICALLGRCSERAMQVSIELLLKPCLSEIQVVADAIVGAVDVGAEVPPMHGSRGRVWVLIGLLRWRLLAPTHPADPSCKYLLKAQLSEERLHEVRVMCLALRLAQESWNGAPSTPSLRQALAAEAASALAMQSARLRASARPKHPATQFTQLHSELQQWGESLGCTEAILELSDNLRDGSATAMHREEVWQQGSSNFLQRLDDAFAHFEDLTLPLELALYEVKHGLRLQALSGAPTVIAAQDGNVGAASIVHQSHAIMAALLCFPAAAPRAHVDDAWRAQLLPLLRPLPSCFGAAPTVEDVGAAQSDRGTSQQLAFSRFFSHTTMLAISLRRLYVSVLLEGGAQANHLQVLDQIVGGFVRAHVEAEMAEREHEEAQAELYARKARHFGAAATDGRAEEAAALRELFPDFSDDFADIQRISDDGGEMDLVCVDREEDTNQREAAFEHEEVSQPPPHTDATATSAALKIDPKLILSVLEYHERVFRFTTAVGVYHPTDDEIPLPAASKPRGKSKRNRDSAELKPPPPIVDLCSLSSPSQVLSGLSVYEEAQGEALGTLRDCHKLASKLFPSVTAALHLPAALDEEARSGSLVVAACCWQHLHGSDPTHQAAHLRHNANLFTDENLSEVGRLEPVLDELLSRMRLLLVEWPDHPTLQMIAMLCERLRSFRAGSPLMKFVTGSEMLLKRCWEWEEVACKATSIKPQIDMLAALVLRWRKMEVEAWPQLLKRAEQQAHEKALLCVWARLFRVVNSHLWRADKEKDGGSAPPPVDVHSTHRAADPEAVAHQHAHLHEFFETFQQLLHNAEAGAFEAYLRLLRAFARQLHVESRLGVRNAMGDEQWRVHGYACILHNLVGYYSQFSEPLRRAVGNKRAPIEAKLKDFIKLAQWQDRNYDSLKQSVERSHASLSRGVRQLQDVLQQPAATLIMGILSGTVSSADESPMPEDTCVGAEGAVELDDIHTEEALAANRLLSEGLLEEMPCVSVSWQAALTTMKTAVPPSGAQMTHIPKLQMLSERMRSICQRSVFSTMAVGNSSRRRTLLDELRVDVVRRATELRELTDKKARMLKHKALVDLLKHLSDIGLSFASNAADPRQHNMADLFQVSARPLDFRRDACGSPTGDAAHVGARWQSDWERCEQLYYRCVLKLTQLRHVRKRAHEDLSAREVQKAAGFVEHGIALLLHQRQGLHDIVGHCADLQDRLARLAQATGAFPSSTGGGSEVCDEGGILPQAALAERRRLARCRQRLLLQQCFEYSVLYKQLAVIVPSPESAEIAAMAEVLEQATRNLQAHTFPQDEEALLTMVQARKVDQLASLIESVLADVETIAARLPGRRELISPLSSELQRTVELIASAPSRSGPTKEGAVTARSGATLALANVVAAMEQAVAHVLLAVQGLRPAAATATAAATAAVATGKAHAAEDSHSLLGEHAHVLKQMRAARPSTVAAKLDEVLAALRSLGDSGASKEQLDAAAQLVAHARPLFHLHLASVRWALHQALGHHAAFVRLELVLLSTFQELFAKGFCSAQHEDKDEEGGGQGDGLEDNVDGTGMGEGEGKQDVSDQLKEEGQLDGDSLEPQEEEARGEKQPKGPEQENERAKEDEGVEMTNDFDGEMMDMEQPEEEPGSEEEAAGDEPEHGIGDLDDENQEVVDERLWDKQEDEDLQPQANDKVEKDAEVAPGDDVTMEAKQEEEEGKAKKKQKLEEEEKQEGSNKDDSSPHEEEDAEEQGEEKTDEDGGEIKAETEYEDSHHKDLKPNKDDADSGDEAQDMPDEAPEQLDNDMSDGGEDADAAEHDADPALPEDAPAPLEEEQDETGRAPPEDPDAEADEEAAEQDRALDGAQPPDAEAEEHGDEPEPDSEDEAGTRRREYSDQQVFEDEGGRFAAGEPQPQDASADKSEEHEANEESMNAPRVPAPASGGDEEGGDYMQLPRGGAQADQQKPPSQRSKPQPNPYNALGDALQTFHQHLNLIQRESSKEEGRDEEKSSTARDEAVGEDSAPPAADFELVGKGEASDTQVLADATQEQVEHGDGAEPPKEDGSADTEDMQVEEAAEANEEPRPAESAIELHDLPADDKQSTKRRGRQAAPQEAVAEVTEEKDEDERVLEREEATEADGAGRIGPVDGTLHLAGADEEGKPEDSAEWRVERSPAVLEEMREELERQVAAWQLDGERVMSSEALWRRFEALTMPLSQELCEQLRLILEATVASKMQGDYRTGKRISMRKVIPYIASGYRKDKIWLRRTKPAQRQYQVMLCVDDSESMRSTGAGGLACEALALICGALSRLEVGQLAVASFAEQVQLLHPFERPFSAESGAHMMSRFTFAQRETDMEGLLRTVVQTLRLAREQQRSSAIEQLQLCIIVSDGRRSPSWGDPSLWVRRASEEKILLCFVIIDSAANKDSILELQSVTYPNGKLTISKWIDAFPFPYYIVLRELRALPQVLSDALRQWFELVR